MAIARLHRRAEPQAIPRQVIVAADQYRAFDQVYLHLVFIHPDVEFCPGDPDSAFGRLDDEWVRRVVADAEERFAFAQCDLASILVVAVGQLAAQVQFDLAAVLQGDLAHIVSRLEVLIRIGQPPQVPSAVRRQRQRQCTNRRRHADSAPGRPGAAHHWRNAGVWSRKIACNFPDFQHGLVLDQMQWMNIQPLLECLPLFNGAVRFMQAHAPMRGGFGDGVKLGLRERGVGH
ncbi:hypothetical protein D3C76_916150 [compost metagenome]